MAKVEPSVRRSFPLTTADLFVIAAKAGMTG